MTATQGSAVRSTTSPPTVVPVKITITDKAVSVSPRVGQRGTIARFILVNHGTKSHTFTFGRAKQGAGTQQGFVRTLKPRQQSTLALFLDYRGTIRWAATMPADRNNPRMTGTFRVT